MQCVWRVNFWSGLSRSARIVWTLRNSAFTCIYPFWQERWRRVNAGKCMCNVSEVTVSGNAYQWTISHQREKTDACETESAVNKPRAFKTRIICFLSARHCHISKDSVTAVAAKSCTKTPHKSICVVMSFHCVILRSNMYVNKFWVNQDNNALQNSVRHKPWNVEAPVSVPPSVP